MSLIEWLPKFQEGKIRLVLGSASQARRKVLEQLGIPIEVMVSDFPEDLDKNSFSDPSEYPVQTSLLKSKWILAKVCSERCGGMRVLVTCDTVVIRDERFIMEKPESPEHAVEMISSLAGRDHAVVTGVVTTLINIDGTIITQRIHKETSKVTMAALTREQIEAYVRTGEPMGKAGAYGIQGFGEVLVSSISGSYTNVVGIPLHTVADTVGSILDTFVPRDI